jgi:hypothetical protein
VVNQTSYPSTYEELKAVEVGHIFADDYHEGIRYVVMRGPASITGYLGLPKDHPLVAGAPDYDDLPLDIHGGLTYSGGGDFLPKGCHWWGWDHAHLGDKCLYDVSYDHDEHLWTPDEVIGEAKGAIWEFKKFMRLAERVACRG